MLTENNVLLLGEIGESVSIRSAVFISDKNGHSYFVIGLNNGKVVFVQSITRLYIDLKKVYDSEGTLEGHEIRVMTTPKNVRYLVIE